MLWLIDCSLAFCQRQGKFLVHESEMTYTGCVTKYMRTWLEEFDKEGVKLPKEIDEFLMNMVLFSVVWGLGGGLEEGSRKKFNVFLQKLISGDAEIHTEYNLNLEFPFEPKIF